MDHDRREHFHFILFLHYSCVCISHFYCNKTHWSKTTYERRVYFGIQFGSWKPIMAGMPGSQQQAGKQDEEAAHSKYKADRTNWKWCRGFKLWMTTSRDVLTSLDVPPKPLQILQSTGNHVVKGLRQWGAFLMQITSSQTHAFHVTYLSTK